MTPPAISVRHMVLLVSLVLAAELGVRLLLPVPQPQLPDERSLLYRYDSRIGWAPIADQSRAYTGSRTIAVANNSLGFRDREHGTKSKRRVVFLGDSFVWGYDVQQNERFTERLQQALPQWDVMNMGVSGYGTDQEYLLLGANFEQLDPDVVFLVFCAENDRDDNSSSLRYGYFKPYFLMENGSLTPAGVPVPKSARYYQAEHATLARLVYRSAFLGGLNDAVWRHWQPQERRVPDPTWQLVATLKHFVESRHARFLCGVTAPSAELTQLFAQAGVQCLDLSTTLRYPSHGNHWTPEGHNYVSRQIAPFLGPNDRSEVP